MRRRRWIAVSSLGVIAAALGLGATPTATAQEAEGPAAAFGGFAATGRANGVQLTYNVENVFPLPAPLFQASVPEATAAMESGPTATALGSVAYPGSLLANLPAVVAQSDPRAAGYVPPYPVRAEAAHPSGPPEARQDIGSATATVSATEAGASATTTMGGGDLPGFIRMGAITTTGSTAFVDGKIESRSRAEATGVDLFFGLLHIDSIVTDLVATTDGATAASAGGTTVSGVTFLGMPASIGPAGVTVQQPAPPSSSGPATPIAEGVGDLTPVADGLSGAVAPLNEALTAVLGTTNASAQDLLAATGISIRTLEPFESVDGASAERTANGLIIEITYDGQGDNPLAALLGAIPAENLPGEGIPGFPINTSPQALVNFMKETHVTGMALAYGNVNVNGSPAFEFEAPDIVPSVGTGGLGGSVGTSSSPSSFSTPTPALPGGAAGGDTAVAGTPAGAAAAGTGAAVAVIIALLSSPLWAVGSRNLADNVLGIAGTSCPDGLD